MIIIQGSTGLYRRVNVAHQITPTVHVSYAYAYAYVSQSLFIIGFYSAGIQMAMKYAIHPWHDDAIGSVEADMQATAHRTPTRSPPLVAR